MGDFDQIPAKLNTECGLKLFTRLVSKKRPSIVNLSPEILPSDGPQPGEMVEICGESSTGKTMQLMDLIAQTILPPEYGGKGATAIVIDTNSNFHIRLQMPQIISKHVIHHRSVVCGGPLVDTEVLENDADVQNIDAIVFEAMKKILFFKCYTGSEYELTVVYCYNFLTTNINVSLLVVDAISTFYWSDLGEPLIRMDTYLRRRVRALRHLADEHKLVAIFTRSMEFGGFTPAKDDLIDYKIHLTQTKDQSDGSATRTAYSYCADRQMSRKFTINEFGIQWQSSKTT